MKRLTCFLLLFCIALSIPLAYFIVRTYRSLEQEELSELQYFAAALFDAMQEELAALILREEKRPVDAYNYYLSSGSVRSPLSYLPKEPYILGYFQNNPDGSFQTPLVEAGQPAVDEGQAVVAQLNTINTRLNTLNMTTISEELETPPLGKTSQIQKEESASFAEKYLDVSRLQQQKTRRDQETPMQHITVEQVLQIAQTDQKQKLMAEVEDEWKSSESKKEQAAPMPITEAVASTSAVSNEMQGQKESQQPLRVEVGPMESLLLSAEEIMIFRRIVIEQQVYRQGFVILLSELLNHLTELYFSGQPLAEFTRLSLETEQNGRTTAAVQAGASIGNPRFAMNRVFPRPFSFLHATLTCARLPRSTGRSTLNVMMVVISAVMFAGLFAIYHSARTVVDLSERRSLFVSSVTHELKTPLTNIRLYIEMLEQGIALTREREEDYLRIVGSESRRLSGLIDNVLEFSKLEKKQRHISLQTGDFDEAIQEVCSIMHARLCQEGFTLNIERDEIPPFAYDREVMVQILLNLLENSIKFGKTSPVREITLAVRAEGKRVNISVSDTGPGIPRADLSKVFDDFYRVDNEITRNTRGAGIGLALVKKFVAASGGTVKAANNDGAGCTITISLPG
ncbi:ATP-binding region, ATPase domain protein domain protein [Candidatus Vecturithrix granuli]|uniref:histidine kinase n=1 Tax=Vecturithrix granuli TaxID=1499967 RepID=A0A081C312_VECG1|nr:ATP-binding region, ATPase domain protein domain protein [Candidatus Vecturithrix granuli]